MVAPESKPPVGIGYRDIMKLVGRTNRRLLGNSHGSTIGEGSQLEGREEEFTRNGGGSAEHDIGGEGAESGVGDVISRANIGLHRRHRRRRLRERAEALSPTNVIFHFSFLLFFFFFFNELKNPLFFSFNFF